MWRGDPAKGKIQFVTSARMPYLIYQACLRTGHRSISVYCQHALADALARDLDLDREQIVAELPPPRTRSAALMDPASPNSGRTPEVIEEVR